MHTCEGVPEGERAWWKVATGATGQYVSCDVHAGEACPSPGPMYPWGPAQPYARGDVRGSLFETEVAGGSHQTGRSTCALLTAPGASPVVVYCHAGWETDSWGGEERWARKQVRRFLGGIGPAEP